MATTIMLVEDNPITRKVVRSAFQGQGFDVVEAPDGASALTTFSERSVALILQDLALPDIDGFDLVSRLRALPGGADVPILALSGLVSKPEEARISAVGFDDVISKPVEPARLVQIVRTHLPSHEPSSIPELFGRGLRVLVADDDPVQRKLVAFKLQKLGFEVTHASDGLEAFEQARRCLPDVIVSDVLMPRLDGFGLCMSIRRDGRLSRVPIVLTTSSYVEAADRELARRAGANDLVLRTPDLKELLSTVRTSLGAVPPPITAPGPVNEIEQERAQRVMQQLERQVALHAGATQRCSLLSAELAVLNGISEALASDDDIDAALQHALAACFDAGGISLGALYRADDSELRVVSFGLTSDWSEQDLRSFFGQAKLLEELIRDEKPLVLPAAGPPRPEHELLLSRAGAASALAVPLFHQNHFLGVLLMMSKSLELKNPDRLLFGQAVAGQISHALAVARAFAQQQASERLAQEQAAVLRSILDSIADGVVVCDESGVYTHWNPAAGQVVRLNRNSSSAERTSQNFGVFESNQVTRVEHDSLPLVRAVRGESVESMELFVRHEQAPEGAWLSVNARPWRDESERIRGGVAVFRDVTHEKAAQAQLLVSDRMASVGMLAAGVAHEINNPLAAVLANLDLAQQVLVDPDISLDKLPRVLEMLDDATTAADRVRLIVRDLKIFSRHEEVRSEAVDVRRVIESSVRMAWNEIRHRSRLVKDYSEVPQVQGTESRLGQVFLNLLVNAAQAIPEGNSEKNTIRVSVRMFGPARVAVEVSDTGSGIPPEMRTRLFTPFSTTKPAGIGSGLGLAICHRIISELAGEIQVESELGRGTTFRVLIPIARQAPDAVVPSLAPASRSERRGRVLVVDDEIMIGTVIRRCLSSEHDVVATTDAAQALARIRHGERFDLILCDLMMPEMTGMQFYGEVRGLMPEVADRIVFLTGGAFTPAARAFLDEVRNERLEKPFDPKHLREVVNSRVR